MPMGHLPVWPSACLCPGREAATSPVATSLAHFLRDLTLPAAAPRPPPPRDSQAACTAHDTDVSQSAWRGAGEHVQELETKARWGARTRDHKEFGDDRTKPFPGCRECTLLLRVRVLPNLRLKITAKPLYMKDNYRS
jgi:hypothetical protein